MLFCFYATFAFFRCYCDHCQGQFFQQHDVISRHIESFGVMHDTVMDNALSFDVDLVDELGVADHSSSRIEAPIPYLDFDDIAVTIAQNASQTHAPDGLIDEPDNDEENDNDYSSQNASVDKFEGNLESDTQSSDSSVQSRHVTHEGSDTEEVIQLRDSFGIEVIFIISYLSLNNWFM